MALYDMAQAAVACDSLVKFQEKEIQAALKLEAAQDSLLIIRNDEIIWCKAGQGELLQQIKLQEGLTSIQKQKKRRRGWIIVGIVVAWVTVEVLTE